MRHTFNEEDAPFKLKAKRDGECAECELEIHVGDEAYWDPRECKLYCLECGVDLC